MSPTPTSEEFNAPNDPASSVNTGNSPSDLDRLTGSLSEERPRYRRGRSPQGWSVKASLLAVTSAGVCIGTFCLVGGWARNHLANSAQSIANDVKTAISGETEATIFNDAGQVAKDEQLTQADRRFNQCLSRVVNDKIEKDPELYTSQSGLPVSVDLSPQDLADLDFCYATSGVEGGVETYANSFVSARHPGLGGEGVQNPGRGCSIA